MCDFKDNNLETAAAIGQPPPRLWSVLRTEPPHRLEDKIRERVGEQEARNRMEKCVVAGNSLPFPHLGVK